jgi:hypothetical protein
MTRQGGLRPSALLIAIFRGNTHALSIPLAYSTTFSPCLLQMGWPGERGHTVFIFLLPMLIQHCTLVFTSNSFGVGE